MKRMIRWHKAQLKALSEEAKAARSYVLRICKLLSKLGGRSFIAKMDAWNNVYEGHIIDHGISYEVNPELAVADDIINDRNADSTIGMIFWGGHYSRKKQNDALSRAWISLLEDCIGNCEGGKLADIHSLTRHLEDFGPKIDFNCKTTEALEELLQKHGC